MEIKTTVGRRSLIAFDCAAVERHIATSTQPAISRSRNLVGMLFFIVISFDVIQMVSRVRKSNRTERNMQEELVCFSLARLISGLLYPARSDIVHLRPPDANEAPQNGDRRCCQSTQVSVRLALFRGRPK